MSLHYLQLFCSVVAYCLSEANFSIKSFTLPYWLLQLLFYPLLLLQKFFVQSQFELTISITYTYNLFIYYNRFILYVIEDILFYSCYLLIGTNQP